MAAFRIVMGPVNDPTLGVPFIYAAKTDPVTHLHAADPRCEIDVVCD